MKYAKVSLYLDILELPCITLSPSTGGWGVALLIIAALWSLTDITNGAAAAKGTIQFGLSSTGFFPINMAALSTTPLVAGWTVSTGATGLALARNLWLLGENRIQQIWPVCPISALVPADTLYVAGGFACLCSLDYLDKPGLVHFLPANRARVCPELGHFSLVSFLNWFGAAPLDPHKVHFALKVGGSRPSAFFVAGGNP